MTLVATLSASEDMVMTSTNRMDGVLATLRDLHAALLDRSRQEHERLHGRVRGTGELLQLVAYGESFAWLRPLSKLMIELDEGETSVTAARAAIHELLMGESEFALRHRDAMQNEPAVVLAHAAVMHSLTPLAA